MMSLPILAKSFLAIDWGHKKVGLATGDLPNGIVTAQKSFLRDVAAQKWILNKHDIQSLKSFCEEWQIEALLLGLALAQGGGDTEESLQARKLGAHLGRALSLPIYFSDERLSSWEARQQGSSHRSDDAK